MAKGRPRGVARPRARSSSARTRRWPALGRRRLALSPRLRGPRRGADADGERAAGARGDELRHPCRHPRAAPGPRPARARRGPLARRVLRPGRVRRPLPRGRAAPGPGAGPVDAGGRSRGNRRHDGHHGHRAGAARGAVRAGRAGRGRLAGELQRARTDRRRGSRRGRRPARRARHRREGPSHPPQGQRPLPLRAHGARRRRSSRRELAATSVRPRAFPSSRTSTRAPTPTRPAPRNFWCARSTAPSAGTRPSGSWRPRGHPRPRDRPGQGARGAGEANRQRDPRPQRGRRRVDRSGRWLSCRGLRLKYESRERATGLASPLRRRHVPTRRQNRSGHGRLARHRPRVLRGAGGAGRHGRRQLRQGRGGGAQRRRGHRSRRRQGRRRRASTSPIPRRSTRASTRSSSATARSTSSSPTRASRSTACCCASRTKTSRSSGRRTSAARIACARARAGA